MSNILAIDLGTTYFNLVLFDRGGRACQTCQITPSIAADEPGRSELPADAFVDAIARGIVELGKRSEAGLVDVLAVSFATQTNSFVLYHLCAYREIHPLCCGSLGPRSPPK